MINTEIWEPILELEGRYEISNFGRIRSIDRYVKHYCWHNGKESTMFRKGVLLKPSTSPNGYKVVSMSYNGGPVYKTVHSLVAKYFVSNPLNNPQINHINGDKKDNNYLNLEWVTASENIKHSVKTGLIKIFNNQYNKKTPNKYAKKA